MSFAEARERVHLRERFGGEGFTLIELMIVMLLIVVLASIVLVQYGNSVTRAKEAVLKEDLVEMRKAIDQYYADKNKFPPALDALVEERYLREIPVDPFTQSRDTWQTTTSEPDPRNPSAQTGIDNVKSGAEQQSLDGTPYAEWE
jgi:general secretion pathway protein G